MLHEIAHYLNNMIFDMGYIGIFLLMMIESSFVPFPSEIVLIPAGYLASKGEMNIYFISLASLLGSIMGALINYFLALSLGRKFILRYGKYVFISPQTLDKMDSFFIKHGAISTFTGRLIPGIRQLISIPAGISAMNLKIFIAYTSLGAFIWSSILIALGYIIGENQELIKEYLSSIIIYTLLALVAIVFIYISKKRKIN
jgi:membrane protein DedA with SNARE-associated domain